MSAPNTYWTRPRILAAIEAWTLAHGRPPTSTEWRKAAPHHPCAVTVFNAFDTWNLAIAVAGYQPRNIRRAHGRWEAVTA